MLDCLFLGFCRMCAIIFFVTMCYEHILVDPNHFVLLIQCLQNSGLQFGLYSHTSRNKICQYKYKAKPVNDFSSLLYDKIRLEKTISERFLGYKKGIFSRKNKPKEARANFVRHLTCSRSRFKNFIIGISEMRTCYFYAVWLSSICIVLSLLESIYRLSARQHYNKTIQVNWLFTLSTWGFSCTMSGPRSP